MFELSNVDLFAAGEEWAKLRRPGLMEFIRQRFGKLAEALGDRPWLAGDFSVADIAMATVLREGIESGAARKSVVEGKRGSVRVDLGGGRIIKTKKQTDS